MMAGFHLQAFFASVKALPCRYLLQAPSFSLRPKSVQIRSKLPFPATTPPIPQSRTQGQTGRKKGEPFWLAYSCVFLFYISYLIKSLLTDICSKHLLFTFAQNRGKFALNCLALQLTLSAKRHTGANMVQKRRTFWLTYSLVRLLYFYILEIIPKEKSTAFCAYVLKYKMNVIILIYEIHIPIISLYISFVLLP